jgi:hypothetical protein
MSAWIEVGASVSVGSGGGGSYNMNAFLKTTVRNNVSVLDFIVHYLLHVSALIGGPLQVKCTQNIY